MATDDAAVSPHFRHLRGLSTTPPAQGTSQDTSIAKAPPCAPSFMRASMLMRQEAQAARNKAGLHERAAGTKEAVKKPRAVKAKPFPVSEEYILDSDDDETTVERIGLVKATICVQARSSYFGGDALESEPQAPVPQAMVRRRSWTPVEDTAVVSDEDDDRPLADRLGHKFNSLVNSFAYPEAPKVAEPDRPVKRQKTSADKAKASRKPRAPKVPKEKKVKAPAAPKAKKTPKKAQTITALATAAYRPQVELVNPQTTIPEVLAKVQIAPAVATKQKRKPAATSRKPKKAARIKSPAKVTTPRVLLDPSRAQATLSNQVFIFGTSSQLHVEDSPETIQQIQTALQQSEMSPGSNRVSPVSKSKSTVPTAPHGTSLSAGQADRDLWCVSARDGNGGVLGGEAETQDSFTTAQETQDAAGTATALSVPLQQDEFVLISSDPPQPEIDVAKPTIQPGPVGTRSPSPSSLPPWPSAQRSVLQPLDANRSLLNTQSHKSPAAARFKSVLSPSGTPSPRRGRPRKETEAVSLRPTPKQRQKASPSQIFETLHSSPPGSWHDIDQIVDPELPASPSPPRRQTSIVTEQALAFDEAPATELETTAKDIDGQWSAIYAKLFPKITSTIRAAPHSNSLTNPSWHEKILLYDPIVIEDLTLWLNAQGLRVRVLKGKGRKKKAVLEPDVEEVEQELSHQMVQKWCEEHSICCLWKEGLRGGVRTRY